MLGRSVADTYLRIVNLFSFQFWVSFPLSSHHSLVTEWKEEPISFNQTFLKSGMGASKQEGDKIRKMVGVREIVRDERVREGH